MTLDLANLKATKDIKPPRIVLYGPPKVGKTSFAASIPDNLILDFEGGSGAQSANRIDKNRIDTFEKVLDVLKQIYDQKHRFKFLTLDTLDWLQEIVFEKAAKEHNQPTVAAVPYGVGFATVQNLWRQILDGLELIQEEKGMAILCLAHSHIVTYNSPTSESYNRVSLKLHEKEKGNSTVSLFREWVDVIAYVNSEVFVKEEDAGFKKKIRRATAGERTMHLVDHPAFLAGNRYALPSEIAFDWPSLQEALSNAMTDDIEEVKPKKSKKID